MERMSRERYLRQFIIGLLVILDFSSLFVLAGAIEPPSSEPGFRSVMLHVPAAGRTGFSLLSPAETGLAFTN